MINKNVIVVVLGENSCLGLNCEYVCNNEIGVVFVCICKIGYRLVNSENCIGKMLFLLFVNKLFV